jgi:hypothetical protein
MSYSFIKPRLLTMFIAILVVFIMATGAFVGAADKGLDDWKEDTSDVSLEVKSLDIAGYTDETNIDPSVEPEDSLDSELSNEFVEPIVPGNSIMMLPEETVVDEDSGEVIPDISLGVDGLPITQGPGEGNVQDDIPSGSTKNSLSDAMSYITDKVDETVNTAEENDIVAAVES